MGENNACGPQKVVWDRAEARGCGTPSERGGVGAAQVNAEAAGDPGTGQV